MSMQLRIRRGALASLTHARCHRRSLALAAQPTNGRHHAASSQSRRTGADDGDDAPPEAAWQQRSLRNFSGPRRYAVVGGGLAGVATAYHLLQHGSRAAPVHVHLFDPAGEPYPG